MSGRVNYVCVSKLDLGEGANKPINTVIDFIALSANFSVGKVYDSIRTTKYSLIQVCAVALFSHPINSTEIQIISLDCFSAHATNSI